jgi:excisionase family DNA binding protein
VARNGLSSPIDPDADEQAERIAARVVDLLRQRPVPILREYLTPEEAAALLGVPERTLANWRTRAHKGGGPPWFVFGHIVRYARADLVAWMQKHRRGTH